VVKVRFALAEDQEGNMPEAFGYAGKILRADLSSGKITCHDLLP